MNSQATHTRIQGKVFQLCRVMGVDPYKNNINPNETIERIKSGDPVNKNLYSIYYNLHKYNLEQMQYLITVLDLESDLVMDILKVKMLDSVNNTHVEYPPDHRIYILLAPIVGLFEPEKNKILKSHDQLGRSIQYPIYCEVMNRGGCTNKGKLLIFDTDQTLLDAIEDRSVTNYFWNIHEVPVHIKFSFNTLPDDITLSTVQKLIEIFNGTTGVIKYDKSIAHICLLNAIGNHNVEIVRWIIQDYFKSTADLSTILSKICQLFINKYPQKNDPEIMKIIFENNFGEMIYNTTFAADIFSYFMRIEHYVITDELLQMMEYSLEIIEKTGIIVNTDTTSHLHIKIFNYIFANKKPLVDRYVDIVLRFYRYVATNLRSINREPVLTGFNTKNVVNFELVDKVVDFCIEYSPNTLVFLYYALAATCVNIFQKKMEAGEEYVEDPRFLEYIKKIECYGPQFEIEEEFRDYMIALYQSIPYDPHTRLPRLSVFQSIDTVKMNYQFRYLGKFEKKDIDALVDRVIYDGFYRYRDIPTHHPAIAHISQRFRVTRRNFGLNHIWCF